MTFPSALDSLIHGRGSLSLILGIHLLRKQKNVLFVDEQKRNALGGGEGRRISYLEKHFLQDLGERYQVSTLLDIDKFVSPSQNLFYFKDGFCSFSSDPKQNLHELKRKLFPGIDVAEDFSDFYYRESSRFVQDLRQKALPLFKWDQGAMEELRYLFNFHAPSPYGENSFFSFLSFVGASYILDEEKFKAALLSEFLSKGGHHKQTSLCDKQKKPEHWVVELESFEGLVYPQAIYNEKDFNEKEFSAGGKVFTRWQTNFSLSAPVSWDFCILSSREMQGSFVPYIELQKTGERSCLWSCLLEQETMATTEQLTLFLEKSFAHGLEILQWPVPALKKSFVRTDEEARLFSSLLRLRDVIMKV